jgi:diguanylate cyclase (GGDEF)-like protein
MRSYDFVGRFGGEEFLIVLPDTGLDEALLYAERMRLVVKNKLTASSANIHRVPVTISLGVASANGQDIGMVSIIKRADDGLYRAKQAGKDQIAWVSAGGGQA